MTPDLTLTIKAKSSMTSQEDKHEYVRKLIGDYPQLVSYYGALIEVVDTRNDENIEIYNDPDREGGFSPITTQLLWIPAIARAAAYRYGDWQWTDASSPEDAIRRYREDDMRP